MLARHGARFWHFGYGIGAQLRSRIYRALAQADPFPRLLPPRLRPRAFAFRAGRQTFLKVIIGRQLVGQYDARLRRWNIQPPFRLFVDEAGLPEVAQHTRLVREPVPGAIGFRLPGPGADPAEDPVR